MTQDEIIRMAREAGLIQYVQVEKTCVSKALERFAALVAAHERERTKDLTDDEIAMCMGKDLWYFYKNEVDFARAVIAADREKNK